MRASPVLALCLMPALAGAAHASSDDAWIAFRAEVASACMALVSGPGTVTIEVNPFGSERFGAALVSLTSEAGTDRMVCIYDKAGKVAELTAPF